MIVRGRTWNEFSGFLNRPNCIVNAPSMVTIGRKDQANAIAQVLAGSDSDPIGAVITGNAGVGKTHLAQRATTQWQAANRDGAVYKLSAADQTIDWPSVDEDGDAGNAMLVCIEDVHLLDADGIDWLVRHARARRFSLIATAQIVTSALSRLVRDGVLKRILLKPFDFAEATELVETMLGDAVSADVVWFIWRTSAGNPRYGIDLIESARADGHVTCNDGTWLLVNPKEPGSRLIDLIRSDVARLTPAEREALDIVALSGALPLGHFMEVADAASIDSLVARGIIVVTDGSDGEVHVRAGHRRFGEIVGELVPPARRRTLYERVFASGDLPNRAVGAQAATGLIYRVRWALSCAIALPVRDLLDAAYAAASLGHGAIAERFATGILRQDDLDLSLRLEALLVRATARRFAGNVAAGLRDADDAYQLLEHANLPAELRMKFGVDVARTRADLAQFARGDYQRAVEVLDAEFAHIDAMVVNGDVAPSASAFTASRAILRADRAMRIVYDGQFALAEAMQPSTEELLALPFAVRMSLDAPMVYVTALHGRLFAAQAKAVALIEAAIEGASEAPWSMLESQAALVFAALWAGDVATLEEIIASVDFDADAPSFIDHAVRQVSWGIYAAARGEWSGAIRELQSAVTRFRLLDFSGWLPFALTRLAAAHAASGESARAAELLTEARTLPLRASGLLQFDMWDHWSRVYLALGSSHGAAIAQMLIERGQKEGLALAEMWGWHLLSLTDLAKCQAEGPARLDVLAPQLDGALAQLRVAHTRAVLAGDQDLMRSCIPRLADLGYWVPMRPGGPAATLSDRQFQVAQLAASGLSSAAIAERLYISKRTVDAHLRSIYERLGVHNRNGLATVLLASSQPTS